MKKILTERELKNYIRKMVLKELSIEKYGAAAARQNGSIGNRKKIFLRQAIDMFNDKYGESKNREFHISIRGHEFDDTNLIIRIYKSGSEVKAISPAISDEDETWEVIPHVGLPDSYKVSKREALTDLLEREPSERVNKVKRAVVKFDELRAKYKQFMEETGEKEEDWLN